MRDPAAWPSSNSPTLVEFTRCYNVLLGLNHFKVSDPTLRSRFAHSQWDPRQQGYQPARAIHGAGLHPQGPLSHAAFKHMHEAALASPVQMHAKARLRACTIGDATVLFNASNVAQHNGLTQLQATFVVCNTLGLHHPFITSAPTCHPKCKGATPEEADNPLSVANHRLAYHHLSCAAGGLLHARHDNLAQTIADVLQRHGGFSCQLTRNLGSSTTGGQKVDVIASSWRRAPQPWAIDVTVSCPMLPTYIQGAQHDAKDVMRRRDKEKTDKHGPGCEALGRTFAAAVYSTFGGVYGKEWLKLFDQIFHDNIQADKLAGGTGWRPAQDKVQAREQIITTLMRGSAAMASQLTRGVGQQKPDGGGRTQPTAAKQRHVHNSS